MKKTLLLAATLFWIAATAFAGIIKTREYPLFSPDQKLKAIIRIDSSIRFELYRSGKQLMSSDAIGLMLADGTSTGGHPVLKKAQEIKVDRVVKPEIREKSETIRDYYQELKLTFKPDYNLEFRLYNEGLAYRIVINKPGEVVIKNELGGYHFDSKDSVCLALEKSFYSAYETPYVYKTIGTLTAGDRFYLPVLVHKADGTGLWLGESNIRDYPGMWFEKSGENSVKSVFPGYPLKVKGADSPYGQTEVLEYAPYISKTKGTRTLPWRIVAVSEKDADLITNQMVYLLADPNEIADPSWIMPGWVILDWWARRNIFGVDFKADINTVTAKYFIDFCEKYGITYFLFDDGWSDLGNILKIRKGLDMDQVMAYAKQKNVKILLWLAAATFERQMTEALDLYEKWGVAGIKVDFMNRDDQVMMNFYEQVLQETAKRHMVVNFHGTCKSTGLRRTFPNLLTQEGLIEFEFSGCSDWDNPDHHNTLPFLRNVAGPMDYIPGTLNNVVKKDFRIVADFPIGMGTRAHSIAMAVTTMSPMQMIPDAPSDYEREPECAKFLLGIPTVWDETRVFEAKMGDYLTLVRRSGKDWYLAATTDWTARDITLDFSFLPEGNFMLDLIRDGINADIRAIDYKMETIKVNQGTKLKVHLAPGGGWVGHAFLQGAL
ncbi:MAG: glycoside hydrolase family 97 protein [Bacteroidales bacterium]|jgi:alpha-glucosidase